MLHYNYIGIEKTEKSLKYTTDFHSFRNRDSSKDI